MKGLGYEISLFSFLEFTCPVVLRHTHAHTHTHTHTHIHARAALVYRKLREGGLSGSWQGPLSTSQPHRDFTSCQASSSKDLWGLHHVLSILKMIII